MMRHIAWLGAGTVFLALLPPAVEAQYANKDLQSGKQAVHSVLILPAQANVVKSGVKGDETLVKESRVLEVRLASEVASFLAGAGCDVLPSTFSDTSTNQSSDLKYALADLQTRFDRVVGELAWNPKNLRTDQFTMGDEVANFNPGAAADALVFIRGEEVAFTLGQKLLGVLSHTHVPNQTLLLSIAIVDARSGAVLYVDCAAPKVVQKHLKKSFPNHKFQDRGRVYNDTITPFLEPGNL